MNKKKVLIIVIILLLVVGLAAGYILYSRYYSCNAFRKNVTDKIGEEIIQPDDPRYKILKDWRFPKSLKDFNDKAIEFDIKADDEGEPEGYSIDTQGNCGCKEQFADQSCTNRCKSLEFKQQYWSRIKEFEKCYLVK